MDGLSKFSWQDIKHNFYNTGELPESIEKKSPIIQAWEQSKQAGLSPFFKVTSLQGFPLDGLSLEDQNLAALTEVVLEDIWQLFGQQDVSVYLINNHSKIIAEKHNSSLGENIIFYSPVELLNCQLLAQSPLPVVSVPNNPW